MSKSWKWEECLAILAGIVVLVQGCMVGPPESPSSSPEIASTSSNEPTEPTKPDVPFPKYNRSDWGSWKVTDCKDTRTRVLESESEIPVIWKDEKECEIKYGKWVDWYTGQYYVDPSQLDIDHVVPLKEAHDSGAYAWSEERKREYFNYMEDPDHLIAVHASANRSKGSKGPGEWLPVEATYHVPYRCTYIKHWISIKEKWGLEVNYELMTHLMMEHCESKLFQQITH